MKSTLAISLLMFSLYSQAQTTCFENDKVKMLDVIDLEEKNSSRPMSEKINKLSAVQKDAVKETKLLSFSMNNGPKEDVKVHYYKNSASEDVAAYNYNGQKFYRVRNSVNGCTALFVNESASKKVLLLASLPADGKDGFFTNGVSSLNYKDSDLEGIVATDNEVKECRLVNDGMTMYSVISNSCGRIKFCKLEAICKGLTETVKAFCKAVDDKCPSFEDCDKDDSFQKLSEDFQKGTIKKEAQSKASGQ
jgi:hypothetical protein